MGLPNHRFPRFLLLAGIGVLLILGSIVLSVALGSESIAFSDIAAAVLHRQADNVNQLIVWEYRLPRTLAAVFIGALLAVGGAILQGITKNPLVSPYIMGVNQGAVLALAVYMAARLSLGMAGRVGFALLGACVGGLLLYFLSTRKSGIDTARLLLAGSALSALFLSLATIIALLSDNSRELAFWMAGGFASATWQSVRVLLLFLPLLLLAVLYAPRLTILALGDEVATGLGENPQRLRLWGILLVIASSAASAAIGGNIGFVCLIVPHITRFLIGSDYRFVIPLSMVFGAVLMVASDLAARLLTSPLEIPVGAITSFLGVPFLIYLIRKEQRI